jgi:hypothetical protein
MSDLKKDYGVFGDYGYVTEELLFESNSVNEAIEFAEGYTSDGMGGYSVIEVAFFAADGTYETTWSMEDEGYLYDEF